MVSWFVESEIVVPDSGVYNPRCRDAGAI